jgi:hypothetical protein
VTTRDGDSDIMARRSRVEDEEEEPMQEEEDELLEDELNEDGDETMEEPTQEEEKDIRTELRKDLRRMLLKGEGMLCFWSMMYGCVKIQYDLRSTWRCNEYFSEFLGQGSERNE